MGRAMEGDGENNEERGGSEVSFWKKTITGKDALGWVPGFGRFGRLGKRSEGQVGALVDAFAAFATLDDVLSAVEADLILDMLRSAFPEVDHSWLTRRLRRAVKSPKPLQGLAADLRTALDDVGKLAIGLQLYTLVDAAGRSERSRATFEIFMRRLGKPEVGAAILREMRGGEEEVAASDLPFERLIFGGADADVTLPPAAGEQEFRIYRVGDLILLRNTGTPPLWVRGKSLSTGAFLRVRERQELVVPGWILGYDDLRFFLDVRRMGNMPSLYLEAGEEGLVAERTRARGSELRVKFGLEAEVEVLSETSLHVGSKGALKVGDIVYCRNHERVGGAAGFSLTMNDLRKRALQSGRRFRLVTERQEYMVSNDAGALSSGDLLLGAKLAPRTVLFIRFDSESATGKLEIREANGPVLVDGLPVRQRATLRDGSLIRLSGSQAVRCRFSEGFLDEERTQIESLEVDGLIHDFGKDSRALDQINFEVRRGEMLCIIGPSGSGKSTLLAVLSGQRKPTRGKVKLNGISLYEHRERLVPFIAHMPQEEALNPQLTVREHLRHGVMVRRPGLALAEHDRRVDSMLAELGLQRIARRRVGSQGEKTISGGERSRLNLGVDLGSRAELFLFDEPISGLSSKDSEHVAETLRALAREKIVIASLHRPGASVLRLFDKVLLIDSGGKMAFFGTPAQMVSYYRDACEELGISHPSMVAKTPLGADFVFDVLETPLSSIGDGGNTGAVRRFPPTFWQERFESQSLLRSLQRDASPPSRLSNAGIERLPVPPTPTRRWRAVLLIFATHFERSLLSKIRSRGTLYSTFLEAPILAALIAITLRSSPTGSYQFSTALHIPAYLFLSVTVAMFLGLTNSATEILRDRAVLRRERNCQPGGVTYVSAKFLALGLVAAMQCFTYLVVGNHFLEIEGVLLYHWIWMTLTALTGTGMALVVSSLVKTERAALTAVPLLLVPQMLLAGALVPFKEMNRGLFNEVKLERDHGGVPVPAMVMPLRYAFEGMLVAQATRNPFELERIRMQRKIDRARDQGSEMDKEEIERFEMVKEGLRRLVASGARDQKEAADLVSRIRRMVAGGTPIEVATMKVWPEGDDVKPTYTYFVNERIELLVREAETFRNDYRNKKPKHVFLALEKPIPFYNRLKFLHPDESGAGGNDLSHKLPGQIETMKFCGWLLLAVSLGCAGITAFVIGRQNKSVK
ncbi:ATP-binding cassette domain-containing protein [Luteolibacter algae]|uniref:ATP-binding cassette domain-containing protein n=1 Tax=Luteolibacter algae TaxID=454151 RepID=A0ABW5D324_9BACT